MKKKHYYIYLITNKLNKKIYIGQRTSLVNPLVDKYFGSGTLLKRAIKKYGKENFEKEIIVEVHNQEELNNAEVAFIKYCGAANNKIGYNILCGGGGVEEVNKRSNFGKPQIEKAIKTVFYNIETGVYHIFYKTEDCVKLGIRLCRQVYECSNNKANRYRNWFIFKYENFTLDNLKDKFLNLLKRRADFGKKKNPETGKKISEALKGIKFSKKRKKDMSVLRTGRNTISVMRDDGIIFDSMDEAAKSIKCTPSSISRQARGGRPSIKGYKFKIIEDNSLKNLKYKLQ